MLTTSYRHRIWQSVLVISLRRISFTPANLSIKTAIGFYQAAFHRHEKFWKPLFLLVVPQTFLLFSKFKTSFSYRISSDANCFILSQLKSHKMSSLSFPCSQLWDFYLKAMLLRSILSAIIFTYLMMWWKELLQNLREVVTSIPQWRKFTKWDLFYNKYSDLIKADFTICFENGN